VASSKRVTIGKRQLPKLLQTLMSGKRQLLVANIGRTRLGSVPLISLFFPGYVLKTKCRKHFRAEGMQKAFLNAEGISGKQNVHQRRSLLLVPLLRSSGFWASKRRSQLLHSQRGECPIASSSCSAYEVHSTESLKRSC
jgi:hypothetical protein